MNITNMKDRGGSGVNSWCLHMASSQSVKLTSDSLLLFMDYLRHNTAYKRYKKTLIYRLLNDKNVILLFSTCNTC